MEDYEFTKPPSLKQRLKNSLCFSCCFRHHRTTTQLPSLGYHPPPPSSDEKPSLIWIKTRTTPPHDNNDPIKEKCRTIFSLVGNNGNRHKRHSSAEFRYDPLSYALNFEDDEAPLRNFSSRLPPSPPPTVKPLSVTAPTTL